MIRFLDKASMDSYDSDIDFHAKRVKVVIAGASGCGKTSFVNQITKGHHEKLCDEEEIFNDISYKMNQFTDHSIDLNFCDISGKPEYRSFLHLGLKNSKVLIGCFNIIQPSSVLELTNEILPLLHPHLKSVYFILVGTFKDQRENCMKSISFSQGWNIAHSLGALSYFEVNNLDGTGVNHVLNFVVDLLNYKENKHSCTIC